MEWLLDLAPFLRTTAAAILVIFVAHRVLERGDGRTEGRQFRNQLFMNTRPLAEDRRFITKPRVATGSEAPRVSPADDVAFDKADAAESLEKLREKLAKTDEEIDALKTKLKNAEGDREQASLEVALSKCESRKEGLSAAIAERDEQGDEDE